MNKIRAAAVQFNHTPGNKEINFSIMKKFINHAAKKKVQIIIFPEMCITGYGHIGNLSKPRLLELEEKIPSGKSTQKLKMFARETNMIIGAGLVEKTVDGKLFDSYVICQPNGQTNRHRKIHAFESEYISCGDRFTVFDTDLGVRLGVLICYDNNIIENGRITALKGADILIAPSQVGGSLSRSPHALGLIDLTLWHNRKNSPKALRNEFNGPKGREWLMRWLPSRAHDNGYFLIFSNGVGLDGNEVRTGNAMIFDPYGRIIKETSEIDNDIVIADLDLSLLDMCTGRRWIRGRKPELYGDLVKPTGKEMDSRTAHFSKKKT